MTVRLFVAAQVDPGVAQEIAACGDELRRRVGERAPRSRISWAPADRLHVTVRFIGDTDEERAKQIASALAPALRIERFGVTFQGISTFPERGVPRVFWVGITAGVEGLTAVAQEVTVRLLSCGVAAEDRVYRPHVTLARVREAPGLRTRALLDGLVDRRFGTSPIEAITLFQSRRSPKGSEYVPLQATNLRVSSDDRLTG